MADKPKGKIEFDEGLHINRIPRWIISPSHSEQVNIFELAFQELKERDDEDEIIEETGNEDPL